MTGAGSGGGVEVWAAGSAVSKINAAPTNVRARAWAGDKIRTSGLLMPRIWVMSSVMMNPLSTIQPTQATAVKIQRMTDPSSGEVSAVVI